MSFGSHVLLDAPCFGRYERKLDLIGALTLEEDQRPFRGRTSALWTVRFYLFAGAIRNEK